MSDILFRGKKLDNGEWVEGYYVCFNDKEHRIYNGYAETDCGDYYPDFWAVDPATVGQYINLNDKNNKQIYSNDICKFVILKGQANKPLKSLIHVIEQRHGAWGFRPLHPELVHEDDREWAPFWHSDEPWDMKYFEVIGNIYDSPELLGVTL